ncbi:MAG TPA: hypothetical protein VJ931_17430, partial [Actinomycetota bacterium]|nr:hypothetical protein [Actinomycetota bacterium]
TFYDVYQRPSRECSPPTARPGSSKHETGLAVDLGGNLALAGREAPKVGLERTVPGEAWHFEPTGDVAGAQLLAGGGLDDAATAILGGAGGALGVLGGPIEDAVGGAIGKLVEPVLGGFRRIALTGLLVAGGVGLVVLGGIRGTHAIERKLL